MRLYRDSPIPLYQQLRNEIHERIASGEWPAGTRLPTEVELVAELEVSRVTVRQALSAAAEGGLVVRVPGKGTFVSEKVGRAQEQGFIGYVVPYLSHSFNVQTLLGVESILKTEGYQLIFCNSEGKLAEENRLFRRLEAEGIAGCIIQPLHADSRDRALYELVAKGYNVVMFDRYLPDVQADLVASDHFGGGYAVVRHLIEQGYTDIIYLARHPLQLSSIKERLRGYQAAMADAGLAPRPPFMVGGPTELAYVQSRRSLTFPESPTSNAIAQFLRGPERPQAIVAMNDLHALLVLEVAQRVGIRIPDDLALAGFDNLELVATCKPSLTTVAQQPFQLGIEAARLLLARIRGESSTIREIRLPARLIIRDSSINPHRNSPSHRHSSAMMLERESQTDRTYEEGGNQTETSVCS
ncbi:MAG: GntR family transcriptional regulator [Chloroflexi bacterium]|nr:GntR family transcriptional regulator [Chloroflexota bacterium]